MEKALLQTLTMTHVSRNKIKFVDFLAVEFFRITAILVVINLIRIHQLTLILNTGLILDYFKYQNFITAISLRPHPKNGEGNVFTLSVHRGRVSQSLAPGLVWERGEGVPLGDTWEYSI